MIRVEILVHNTPIMTITRVLPVGAQVRVPINAYPVRLCHSDACCRLFCAIDGWILRSTAIVAYVY
jgi:hypothetical protein